VEVMIGRLLNLKSPPDSHHAADALAVAICYLHSAKIRELTNPSARSLGTPARKVYPL
jgi:Holliday junction resolvasome RuvABC endonuclease subunit